MNRIKTSNKIIKMNIEQQIIYLKIWLNKIKKHNILNHNKDKPAIWNAKIISSRICRYLKLSKC